MWRVGGRRGVYPTFHSQFSTIFECGCFSFSPCFFCPRRLDNLINKIAWELFWILADLVE